MWRLSKSTIRPFNLLLLRIWMPTPKVPSQGPTAKGWIPGFFSPRSLPTLPRIVRLPFCHTRKLSLRVKMPREETIPWHAFFSWIAPCIFNLGSFYIATGISNSRISQWLYEPSNKDSHKKVCRYFPSGVACLWLLKSADGFMPKNIVNFLYNAFHIRFMNQIQMYNLNRKHYANV